MARVGESRNIGSTRVPPRWANVEEALKHRMAELGKGACVLVVSTVWGSGEGGVGCDGALALVVLGIQLFYLVDVILLTTE